MLPKATLLRDEFSSYAFSLGKGDFRFTGGAATPVPVAVALELQKKMKKDGTPLFFIDKLPEIAERSEDTSEEQNDKRGAEANQLRIEGWHLNAQ